MSNVLPVDRNRRPAVAHNKRMRIEVHPVKANVASESGLDFYVPDAEGFITYLKGILVRVPAVEGATTGTHMVAVYYETKSNPATDESTPLVIVEAHVPYNKPIEINAGYLVGNTAEILHPSDVAAWPEQLNNVTFDSGVKLGVYYHNNTDAEQTGTIERKFVLLDEQVITHN